MGRARRSRPFVRSSQGIVRGRRGASDSDPVSVRSAIVFPKRALSHAPKDTDVLHFFHLCSSVSCVDAIQKKQLKLHTFVSSCFSVTDA